LNAQIKEISDKKVKEVKDKINKLAQQIEKLAHVSKLTVEINTIDRNIQKAKESIENAKADILKVEDFIRKSFQVAPFNLKNIHGCINDPQHQQGILEEEIKKLAVSIRQKEK
jgi:outer membrane murein-binding lipoprotein Lpp